ncbi:aspartate aminotransferase family protein [Salinibacterium sp. M195]|uniref:aspartate aminotransferase family protein n=1 Tax=Salinibacterium sp. M195 TaxID=2583374 RepID=UPI001C626FF3|nr:aspartate aminotransferase family protein [Salinibacterium sp. M195]QYH35269.1 aspartate aminotransferase family protein [Salinibacterium sp. M195]
MTATGEETKVISEWPKSREAWERASRSVSGGVATALRATARPHPLFFTGGAGATLTDFDGNDYIDYVLGWGPNILGHGNPALVAAVQDQITRGATYGSGHLLEFEIAERLLQAFPCAERVLWSNTGTEANLSALRIARAATGREHFVKFAGHYHGWSDPMLVGYRPRAESDIALESRGQATSSAELAHVLNWGRAEELETLLTERDDIAAVFLEPVLCNSGVIEPPLGFLERVREICDEHGVVLIFDEVITGLRIAFGGAVERYGVAPDIIILAKAVAGGLSLAALLGKASLLDLTLNGVTHAGTYNGNPLVLAAAGATLDELSKPGVYERFETLSARLANGFRDALAAHNMTGAVNQVGPVVQVTLGLPTVEDFSDFQKTDQESYAKLLLELLRRGIFAVAGGRWYLSTAHTEAQIDHTIGIFDEALTALESA